MVINGEEKSSRSKADLFEVKVTQGLIKHYNINRDYSKEIRDLEVQIRNFTNGERRLGEQFERIDMIVPEIIKFLDGELNKNKKIKDVKWIGRKHKKEASLSDVDIIFADNTIIGVSLKSVGSGTGTQKNLGYDAVKKYLNIDIENDINRMWSQIRNELKKEGSKMLKKIAELPKTAIKNNKRRFSIIGRIGKKYGFPVQVKAIKQSVENFNKLTIEGKKEFLKCIFGIENVRRLLNVIVTYNHTNIYWNEKFDSLISSQNIEARVLQKKSYGIYIDGDLILRVQASFTNGIGISAFCQRAFLVLV